jgi:hypothetical protein
MSITVAFAPETGISAEQFVAEWNQSANSEAIGSAEIAETQRETFIDPAGVLLIASVITGIGVNVFSTALSDFLKEQFGKQDQTPAVNVNIVAPEDMVIHQIPQADGSVTFVITAKED